MTAGRVFLVGAGPGAHDLITLRGLRIIRNADLIIADSLVPPTFLGELGVDGSGRTIVSLPNAETRDNRQALTDMALSAARQGKTVVLLKGGDPFLCGGTADELEALSREGIPWEVVPGLSASTAGSATAASMPASREEGRPFCVVAGRVADGTVNDRLPCADSLTVLTAADVLEGTVRHLLASGWDKDAPATLIERATLAWERRVRGPLFDIARIARDEAVSSPAVLAVGRAAERGDAFQKRPTVLFTGLDPSDFRTLGEVLHWPALRVAHDEQSRQVAPGTLAALGRGGIAWVIFASKIGVRSFFSALNNAGHDCRLLGGSKLLACGAGTERMLTEYGLRADAVANPPGSPGILAAVGTGAGAAILLAQGTHAPQGLQAALEHRGWRVSLAAVHRLEPHPELGRPLPAHDVIYFVSPSGVMAYWLKYGSSAFLREIWCIGPATLDAVRKLGYEGREVCPHVSANEDAAISTL